MKVSSHATRMAPVGVTAKIRTLSARTVAAWRTPPERRIVLSLVAAIGAVLVFARIAEDYLTNDPLAQWDVSLARWLSEHREAGLLDLFRALTFVGSPAFAFALATLVFVALYRRRRLLDAAFLPLVLGGAEFLNVTLKLAFHRSRPTVGFVHLDTYSFPSGHAMISTAAYGALACLLWSRVDSRRSRLLVVGTTALVVALIAFSRIYLGVHYLSDVLAGIAGGAAWLALSLSLATAYGARVLARFDGSRVDRLARRLTGSRR